MTKEEAIETLKLMQGQIEWDYPMEYATAIDMAVDALAEPERKKGEWIHDGSQWENRWLCSECGYKWFFPKEEAHYCPNCGAELR